MARNLSVQPVSVVNIGCQLVLSVGQLAQAILICGAIMIICVSSLVNHGDLSVEVNNSLHQV